MLTPTDVHLIVGVLSKLETPDNVDIVLGEMVYDEASQRKRDIDITIRYKDELGEEVSFVGIQVKDHGRKLGSPEVEQLCQHFKDSKSIRKGGIVSSSGFTKPAINKAAYHKIDLYEFRDWNHSLRELPNVKFDRDFKFKEVTNVFTSKPNVTYIINESLTEDEIANFNGNTQVENSDGTTISKTNNLSYLNNNLINNALISESISEQLNEANVGDFTLIDVVLNIEKPPVAIIKDRKIVLRQAHITGQMQKVQTEIETKFKILTKLNDPNYQIGSAISELTSGQLIGFTTTKNDKSIKLVTIPIADRLRQKIHQLKIK